jgi:hypothetical protein
VYGVVRWGLKWGFSAFISGFIVYSYILLDLPGTSIMIGQSFSNARIGFSVLAASLLGWFIAYLTQRFSS